MLRRDERSHLRLGIGPGSDDHRGHPRRDLADELVADRADRDDDGHRHAALAGRTETGRNGGVRRGTHVSVGEHDHVVLRAAEGLDPLAVPGTRLVDVAGDRRAAHERHRGHARVLQERVHRDGVTVEDIEDTVGHAGLLGQLGQEERWRWVLLGGLEHEGVPACDGVGQHPERDHDREVERSDAGHHAEGLEDGVDVHTVRHLARVRALQQVRDPTGELDVVEAARHLPRRVAQHFAVFGGNGGRQVGRGGRHQVAEPEQDGRSGAQRSSRPVPCGLGRGVDRRVHLTGRGQRDGRRLHPAGGVVDGAGPS